MSKLYDPIHFFNSRGLSVLTQEHQIEEMNKLRAENNDLKRKLRAMTMRLRAIAGDKEADKPAN